MEKEMEKEKNINGKRKYDGDKLNQINIQKIFIGKNQRKISIK